MELMKVKTLLLIAMVATYGCAGIDPNPGERAVDMAWERGDYAGAHSIIRSSAERGEPWAQLRLGVTYELGIGVAKDTKEALKWYRKAAVQMAEGGWAEGKLVGAVGKAGYFNQNSDALTAQHRIANIYLRGDGVPKDLIEAYLWAKNVSDKTQRNSPAYCCEFSGGRSVSDKAVAETLSKIEAEMTTQQKKVAMERFKNWKPY